MNMENENEWLINILQQYTYIREFSTMGQGFFHLVFMVPLKGIRRVNKTLHSFFILIALLDL